MQKKKQSSVDELIKQADEQLVEYLKSGKYKEFLKSMSNLYNYSLRNQMLIFSQQKNASLVKGLSAWNSLGRTVLPGQKGIKIIMPIIKNLEDENEKSENVQEQISRVVGYKAGHVFDYSQTQGKELEILNFNSGIIDKHYQIIIDALKSTVPNYLVQFVPYISGGADGVCAYKVKIISVKDNMSKEKMLTTLIHEIAHALAESVDRTNFKGLTQMQVTGIEEVEAESVALVVSNKLGLNTDDFNMGYIANWSNQNIEMFRDNLEVIKNVSSQILKIIEPQIEEEIKKLNIQEQTKEKEKQMKDKIKILIKEPYKKPYIKEVEDELKSFQDIVGGYIECVGCPTAEDVDIVCNEEGKINNLPGNFFVPEYEDCIVGTVFAVGYNDEGDWISITEDQTKRVSEYMEKYALQEGEELYSDFYAITNRINKIHNTKVEEQE
jgi:Zn-dependent peptidase ImmA (M78 family)